MWTPQIEFFIKALMDIKSNLKNTEPKYSGKSGKIFCLWCTVILLSHLKRANLKLSRQDFFKEWGYTADIHSPAATIDYLTCPSDNRSFQHFHARVFCQIFVLTCKTPHFVSIMSMALLLEAVNARWHMDGHLLIQPSHTF